MKLELKKELERWMKQQGDPEAAQIQKRPSTPHAEGNTSTVPSNLSQRQPTKFTAQKTPLADQFRVDFRNIDQL